mgnify:CR=1 FL=1
MSTNDLVGKQEPQLKILVGKLRTIISGYMELTRQINNKVEDIGYNRKPIDTSEPEELPKPNNFIEEMTKEIEKLEKNAKKLEEIRNRLNELI